MQKGGMPLFEEHQLPARHKMVPRKHVLVRLPRMESLSRRSRIAKEIEMRPLSSLQVFGDCLSRPKPSCPKFGGVSKCASSRSVESALSVVRTLVIDYLAIVRQRSWRANLDPPAEFENFLNRALVAHDLADFGFKLDGEDVRFI